MQCSKCKKWKDESEFYPYNKYTCKSCVRKYTSKNRKKYMKNEPELDEYIRPDTLYSIWDRTEYIGVNHIKENIELNLNDDIVEYEGFTVELDLLKDWTTDVAIYSIASWMDFSKLSQRTDLYSFLRIYFKELMMYLTDDICEYEKLHMIDYNFLYAVMCRENCGEVEPSSANLQSMNIGLDTILDKTTNIKYAGIYDDVNVDLDNLTKECKGCGRLIKYKNESILRASVINDSLCKSCSHSYNK